LTGQPTVPPSSGQASPTPTPTQTAPLDVGIASLPASVAANSSVTVVVTTSPGATCRVKVKDHAGVLSGAAGLKKKQVADSSGTVSWTWTVEPKTSKGNSTITVTCRLGGRSGSKSKVVVVL